ncbi:MAG: hypothetical protein M3O71_02335 [Bacteroidota bacterium]|nr:hypothetical protein [Bacteroidota bacterium]
MPLKLKSTDHEEIENAVILWIKLLSEEKYEEAYDLTMHDPYYQWTPVSLKRTINGYGSEEEIFEEEYRVTAIETAVSESVDHKVYKDIRLFDTPLKHSPSFNIVGDVHYDLPLNGQWSDLIASFKILQYPDFVALQLNEIHVF